MLSIKNEQKVNEFCKLVVLFCFGRRLRKAWFITICLSESRLISLNLQLMLTTFSYTYIYMVCGYINQRRVERLSFKKTVSFSFVFLRCSFFNKSPLIFNDDAYKNEFVCFGWFLKSFRVFNQLKLANACEQRTTICANRNVHFIHFKKI